MGSAAACHVAGRGAKILGLEAFTPAHDQGSSHGESRIIRQAYFEDPAYVPLILAAYELWDRLQAESHADLLRITGGLAIGSRNGRLVAGCLKSATQYGLKHQLLGAEEMRKRFPQFSLADDDVAFYEEKAGFLRPEECIRQHLILAAQRGAHLQFQEPVRAWTASPSGDRVRVTTDRATYEAASLVISAGAWFAQVAPGAAMPVRVTRKVMFWMKPSSAPDSFNPDVFPIYLWETPQGPLFYGFPRVMEDGLPKVAIHTGHEACESSTVDRVIHESDERALRAVIKSRIPALNGEVSRAATCMYTMTPDEHFIVDRHPEYPQVSLATGFSGHGFKFSSVIGEILADLALTRNTAREIALFSASRFHP